MPKNVIAFVVNYKGLHFTVWRETGLRGESKREAFHNSNIT